MVVRHILFAGLCATASFANAGLVAPAEAPAAKSAFAYMAGPAQAGPADAFQTIMGGGGNWTGVNRLGDRGNNATMLFSQRTGSAPSQSSAVIEAPKAEVAAAPSIVIDVPKADVSAGTGSLVDVGTTVGADVTLNVGGVAAAAVPEPATGMLLLAGLLGVGALTRRRT